MENILLLVFFSLVFIFSALWMKEKYGEEDTRTTVKNVYKQLSSIEEKVSAMSLDSLSKQDDQETDGPVTKELVRKALLYHRFTLDESDPEELDIVNFSYDEIHYRLNTRNLPYFSIEAGFRFEPEKEEGIDLMKQIAQIITNNMYIAKVFVSEKGYYVFQVDALSDNYLSFRNNLRRYLDILIDAQHRFGEMYHEEMEGQKKASKEALQTTLLAAQTDAAGNKLLS